MFASMDQLGPFGRWLVEASWQAAVLATMVMFVQMLCGRWLNARWRYALWGVVIVRLLMPVVPESPLSVHNLTRLVGDTLTVSRQAPVLATEDLGPASLPPTAGSVLLPLSTPPGADSSAPPGLPPEPFATADTGRNLSAALLTPRLIATVWFTGTGLLAAWVLAGHVRLMRQVRATSGPSCPRLSPVLDGCRQEMNITRPVRILETDVVPSPPLMGLRRPTILLPTGLADRLTSGELRYVLLHELAHHKHGDIALNWLLIALQAMHWFNPVIWIAFAKLRADRELARDATVLRRTGAASNQAYGHALLRVLEHIVRPGTSLALAGIGESRRGLRRRMKMIAAFPRRRPYLWIVGAALLVTLAALGLTDAAEPAAPDADSEGADATEPDGATISDGLHATSTQPVAFGPASTRVLIFSVGGPQAFLDLENGKILTWTDPGGPDDPTMSKVLNSQRRRSHWARSSGADLMCHPYPQRYGGKFFGLLALDAATVREEEIEWNELTSAVVADGPLPKPRRNIKAGGRDVDFVVPQGAPDAPARANTASAFTMPPEPELLDLSVLTDLGLPDEAAANPVLVGALVAAITQHDEDMQRPTGQAPQLDLELYAIDQMRAGLGTDFKAVEAKAADLATRHRDPADLGRIYATIAHTYGQSGGPPRTIAWARKALEFPLEPITRLRMYMYWGAAAYSRDALAVRRGSDEARATVVLPHLLGIREAMRYSLPEIAPELPNIDRLRTARGAPVDPEAKRKHRRQVQAHVVARFVREMVACRDALVRQCASQQFPVGARQDRLAAALQDPKVVAKLVAVARSVKGFRSSLFATVGGTPPTDQPEPGPAVDRAAADVFDADLIERTTPSHYPLTVLRTQAAGSQPRGRSACSLPQDPRWQSPPSPYSLSSSSALYWQHFGSACSVAPRAICQRAAPAGMPFVAYRRYAARSAVPICAKSESSRQVGEEWSVPSSSLGYGPSAIWSWRCSSAGC